MSDFGKVPSVVLLLILFLGGVNDGVCLDAVANSSSFGVLASDVDGVDDGVHEYGVTYDGLVIHQPYVDQSTVWVNVVVGVVGVVLEHVVASLAG